MWTIKLVLGVGLRIFLGVSKVGKENWVIMKCKVIKIKVIKIDWM